MKKRVIQIKESDLNKLVRRLVNENDYNELIDVELKGDSTKIKATKKQFKDFMNEPGCSILGKMPDLRPEDISKVKKAFPKNPLNEAETRDIVGYPFDSEYTHALVHKETGAIVEFFTCNDREELRDKAKECLKHYSNFADELKGKDVKCVSVKKIDPNNYKRLLSLDEGEMLSEGVLLNEGIKDAIKSMVSKMASSLIKKLGSDGKEVYEKLVDEFGVNPSLSDIKNKLSSGMSLKEDVGVGEYDEIVGKDGNTTLLDKIMGRISQIAGINLMSFGIIPSALAMYLDANVGGLNSGIVYMVGSFLVSFIILGLHSEYKANREGKDSYFKS
jgi:hypothetical protein